MTSGARCIAEIPAHWWPLRRITDPADTTCGYWASPGYFIGQGGIGIDHVSMLQAEQLGIVVLDDTRTEARLVNATERKPLYTPDVPLPDGRPVPPPAAYA